MDIEGHNAEVDGLWEAFGRKENPRVPIGFATDEAVWLDLTGHTFRDFYTDPAVQLRVLLEGAAWLADNVVADHRIGPPDEAWTVTPRFWMDEPEFFGCDVAVQENDFAWSRPLECSKDDLLARIADIDPAERIKDTRLWKLYIGMKAAAEGDQRTFRDLPVRVGFPGGGTHGIFTTACRVRGETQLCLDLVDDPDFAESYLRAVTEKIMAHIHAWHTLAETGAELPGPGAWGMADDSILLLSAEMYERFVLPCHETIYSAMGSGQGRGIHCCGRAMQLYRSLHEKLGVKNIDGPALFVDHGAFLAEMPGLSFSAQGNHDVVLRGGSEAIDDMMRRLLTPAARQPGRFSVMGFILRGTPLENIRLMYEAGKKHGRIGKADEK